MEGDFNFFARRALQEREAGMRAADLRARRAHLDLAARYDDLVAAMLEHERRLGLPLSGAA